MEPVKCDICGEEIKVKDLYLSAGKVLRFCKVCKKGLADGLLPLSANRPNDGLSTKSAQKKQGGLYPANPNRDDGLYPVGAKDSEGLFEPEEE